jgi:hypothetical protein
MSKNTLHKIAVFFVLNLMCLGLNKNLYGGHLDNEITIIKSDITQAQHNAYNLHGAAEILQSLAHKSKKHNADHISWEEIAQERDSRIWHFSELKKALQKIENNVQNLHKDCHPLVICPAPVVCPACVLDDCKRDLNNCNNISSQCQSDLNISNHTLVAHNLLFRSVSSGAVYSLVPELISDSVEYLGYSQRASSYAAMLVQAGLIAYTTYDYVPTLTGIAVRKSCNWLGVDSRVSSIAGTTAAVVTSVARASMDLDQEVLIDCGIAMAGSFVGSTWALHAKDWVYSFWKKSPQQILEEERGQHNIQIAQAEDLTEDLRQQAEQLRREKEEGEELRREEAEDFRKQIEQLQRAEKQRQTEEEIRKEEERQKLVRQSNINNAKKDIIPDTEELYHEMINNIVLKRSISTSYNSLDDL